MLLSILMLVRRPLALTRVWLSALALGVSILSKELTIFVGPVLLAMVFLQADRSQRWFAAIGWSIVVGSIFLSYPLMAALKSELFPTGTLLGGTDPHVSLLGSLQYQMERGKDAGLLGLNSIFWTAMFDWIEEAPTLVIGGTISAVISVLGIKWRPLPGSLGLLTLSLYAFLGRGGMVIGFYLVPLLPLLALSLGLLLGALAQHLRAVLAPRGPVGAALGRAIPLVTAGVCLITLVRGYDSDVLGFTANPLTVWNATPAYGQNDATDWLRRNVRSDATMIVDCYAWLDLQAPPREASRAFQGAHWYWKIDLDPEIAAGAFRNDARTTDYLLVTPVMFDDARVTHSLKLVREAIDSSTTVAQFDSGGYPVQVRRLAKLHSWPATNNPMLQRSWAAYEQRFIVDGRVVDPGADRVTTSEGQAYALLRAVYVDDRAAFDTIWAWTRTRLQVRGDGLLAWKWAEAKDASSRQLVDGSGGVLDMGTATDADQDAALALLFAARRWHAPEYQRQAQAILHDIWERETAVVAGKRVVVAGDWASQAGREAVVNPSYLAPYAYRIFAEADPSHPWRELVESSYALLEQIQTCSELGGTAGTVPNWIALDAATGQPKLTAEFGAYGQQSSFDASRLPWRLALDLAWYGEPRAKLALNRITLPARELNERGRLFAAYNLDGTPAAEYESLSMYAGTIPSLLFRGDDDRALRLFGEKVLRGYDDSPWGTSWGEGSSYYDENWAWFATAYVDGSLSNLWANQTVVDWGTVLARVAAMPSPGGPSLSR